MVIGSEIYFSRAPEIESLFKSSVVCASLIVITILDF